MDIEKMLAKERQAQEEYERNTKTKEGYTILELRRMFDKIANPLDWRGKINTFIPKNDLEQARAACRYFTATDLVVCDDGARAGDVIHVEAIGYRAGPAGDH